MYKPSIPIVYNSSGYETIDTLKRLEGYADIFLMDFKYINSEKSKIYSNAIDYPKICKDALLEAYRQQPQCVFENGIMKKGVIVRHLLMPQSTMDAIQIFDWVREYLPNSFFSIMSQYMPLFKATNMKIINRKITEREYNKVVSYIFNTGFQNCYVQELSSAKKDFIPDFDFTGI